MTEKWNLVTLGGDNQTQAASELSSNLSDIDISPVQAETEHGDTVIRVDGYTMPSSDTAVRVWFLDQLKTLGEMPDWAVITHSNTTDDGGRAWVLRNHTGHMDLIDVVLGHNNLFGEDVQRYLTEDHGIEVPVWGDSIQTDSDAISVGGLGKAMANIPENTIEQAIARFPQFDRVGTLADSISDTQPDSAQRGDALSEERSVELSPEELAFLQKTIRDYLSPDADDFVDEWFVDTTFTGTWEEYKTVFWDTLDAVLSNLYATDLDRETQQEFRAQAKTLKWDSALDWHR